MSIPMSYEQRKQIREEYNRSIRKVKVDKKSAEKIFKIIREKTDGIMDGNLMMGSGVRVGMLIRQVRDHIEMV